MRAHPLFALLAMMGFLCAAVLGFAPATPRGVQCPTAIVQAVAERDCCGRVVLRKPRPGDRAFVQCACAEKKSASQRAVASGLKFEIAAPAPFAFTVPASPPSIRTALVYAASSADWRGAPPTRPPVLS